jgi:hypothetical protein
MSLNLLLLWHIKTPSGMILDFELEYFLGTNETLQTCLNKVKTENEKRCERLKILWQIVQLS